MFMERDPVESLIDIMCKPKVWMDEKAYPISMLNDIKYDLIMARQEPEGVVKDSLISDALDRLRLLEKTLLGVK